MVVPLSKILCQTTLRFPRKRCLRTDGRRTEGRTDDDDGRPRDDSSSAVAQSRAKNW